MTKRNWSIATTIKWPQVFSLICLTRLSNILSYIRIIIQHIIERKYREKKYRSRNVYVFCAPYLLDDETYSNEYLLKGHHFMNKSPNDLKKFIKSLEKYMSIILGLIKTVFCTLH